jgi:hypothetical protein
MTKVDHLSLIAVPIALYFRKTCISNATAFVWSRHGQYYLITNWHVLSGRNSRTGENLHKCGAWPNKLRAQFSSKSTSNFWKESIEIPLLDSDDRARWLAHPLRPPGNPNKLPLEETTGLREGVDVVALKLDVGDLMQNSFNPANVHANDTLPIEIGMEVFILGYPFGAEPPAFPVWKRGSIASEPALVKFVSGFYLVDTASRPGMSGSPVILRSRVNGREVGGRPRDKFLGVYSGRFEATKDEAQIGRVWHESLIDDIIDAGQLDECVTPGA